MLQKILFPEKTTLQSLQSHKLIALNHSQLPSVLKGCSASSLTSTFLIMSYLF